MGKTVKPSKKQLAFFEKYVLGKKGMVFTLKTTTKSEAWTSCNLRGPFELDVYSFPGKLETVLHPSWLKKERGESESKAHAHVPWELVKHARVRPTGDDVRKNIAHDYKLMFLDANGDALFWFYIKDATHPAVKAKVDTSL